LSAPPSWVQDGGFSGWELGCEVWDLVFIARERESASERGRKSERERERERERARERKRERYERE